MMSGVTEHLGLGVTRSVTYYSPYDIAQTFAILDHLSNGRAAWNVVTSINDGEARNFGAAQHLQHEARYDRAEEFLEVVHKPWGSWDEDQLLLDERTGVFADSSKVRHIDHYGPWFKCQGPRSVPRSPQRRPAIMKAGSSERGKEFAARWGQILSRSIRPRGAQGLLRRRQVPYGQVRPAAQVLQDLSSADSVHKGDREYRQGEAGPH